MKIYVDTSVFGGCFDVEFSIWSNRNPRDLTDEKEKEKIF